LRWNLAIMPVWSAKIKANKGLVTQAKGTSFEIILKDVWYVPNWWVNFVIYLRVHLYRIENILSLKMGEEILLKFDHKMTNGSITGWLLGIENIWIQEDT